MKNPFTRLRSWYTANRNYGGFAGAVVFGFGSIFLLIYNIVTDTTPLDWVVWLIWLQSVIFDVAFWQKNKHDHNLFKFYTKLLRNAQESEYAAIENSEQYRRWLVSANRRRKRAERKLKKQQEMYRYAMSRNVELLHKVYEYESVLLDANLAMADISSWHILPDTAAMAEAQKRFKAYMKIHYAEIANRQLNRELKKSAFGCLFFGDVKDEVKETYYGSKEFGQQLFADADKDANACLGALLGIQPEDEQPQS